MPSAFAVKHPSTQEILHLPGDEDQDHGERHPRPGPVQRLLGYGRNWGRGRGRGRGRGPGQALHHLVLVAVDTVVVVVAPLVGLVLVPVDCGMVPVFWRLRAGRVGRWWRGLGL